MNAKTKYIVVEKTLKELINLAKNGGSNIGNEILYEYIVDRSDISEEQKKIQEANRWTTEHNADIYVSDDMMFRVIERTVDDKVLNGCKNGVFQDAYNDLMNLKVRTVMSVEDVDGMYVRINTDTELEGDEEQGLVVYSRDVKELESKFKSVKRRNSYGHNNTSGDAILLEKVTVGLHYYSFRNTDDRLTKLLKRYIREHLTYCLKKDKVIIPEEYLKKGKEGIAEWRELKSLKNKNNSIEKRLLKQAVRDKKKYALDCMHAITHAAITPNYSWSIPTLEIEGRFNNQKMTKLIAQLINTKDRQAVINISEEDIVRIFKDYWKTQLEAASKEIDKITAESIKNQ